MSKTAIPQLRIMHYAHIACYMKLDDYLNANGISGADFADRIGVNAATVYRIRTGRVFPHKKTIRAIIAATEGAVTVNDLLLSQQQLIRKKENL